MASWDTASVARGTRAAAVGLATLLVVAGCGSGSEEQPASAASDTTSARYDTPFRRFEEAAVTDLDYAGASLDRWREEVPGIADVRIPSSIDEYQQPALWLAHDRDEPRPLLVVLHSWGVDYQQHLGIPYAVWAQQNGWAMVHPDFRGVLADNAATGSDPTIQDVLDAIAFAESRASIDPDQVFIVGYSGGGMMALLMAGRHPDRVAGVVAWDPIHDLIEWYRYSPGAEHAQDIELSCGGDPTADEAAERECTHRSPSAHLDRARQAGVPIYIGHGLSDTIVPTVHGARVFNQLADEADRLTDDELAFIERNRLPDHLLGEVGVDSHFREADPAVVFARRSGWVTFVVFDGGHEGVFNPGLGWMVEQLVTEDQE